MSAGRTPADRAGRPVPDEGDSLVVRAQLGRAPRGSWDVTVRCRRGLPEVIRVAPELQDGTPFPTTFWLTCPAITGEVGRIESAGGAAAWGERIAHDRELARAAIASDAAYRDRRRQLAVAGDPCGEVGVAGQADPLAVKCLHARVAAALAGTGDPVGAGVLAGMDLASVMLRCAGTPCAAFLETAPGAGSA